MNGKEVKRLRKLSGGLLTPKGWRKLKRIYSRYGIERAAGFCMLVRSEHAARAAEGKKNVRPDGNVSSVIDRMRRRMGLQN